MLEQYFVKPATVDRIRGSWIATEIETYVAWLVEHGYSTKSIWRRVPIVFAFGEFARDRGAGGVGLGLGALGREVAEVECDHCGGA